MRKRVFMTSAVFKLSKGRGPKPEEVVKVVGEENVGGKATSVTRLEEIRFGRVKWKARERYSIKRLLHLLTVL